MKISLRKVDLDDKYTLDSGRIFITGTQALVRLPLMQKRQDEAKGLHTAGFISGYRGSPLGGFDQALWKLTITHKYYGEARFHPSDKSVRRFHPRQSVMGPGFLSPFLAKNPPS